MNSCVTNTILVVPIQRTVHHKNKSLNDDNSLSRRNQKFSLIKCMRASDAQCKFAANRLSLPGDYRVTDEALLAETT